MTDYPQAPVAVNHIEPAPRRVRAVLANETVIDTIRAIYVWEWPYYPHYYVPAEDIAAGTLHDEDHLQRTSRGTVALHALRVGGVQRPHAVRIHGADALPGLAGMARVEWDALDAWYEEDEQIFVHPRSPYSRVDALRSRRRVRVELDGTVLADSPAPVMVFETGLPTRYYLDRSDVRFEHLLASDTVTSCPYKGTTSAYWSVRVGEQLHADLAWSYDFPTAALGAIGGLVAFYNEKLDIFLDGRLLERPATHFS